MNIRTLLLAITGMVALWTNAQDSLFYTNGSVIIGQVEEIGLDQIRYRTNSAGNQVLIVVYKRDLSSVKLKGGQTYTFATNSPDEPHSEAFLKRKRAITFDVLAPALDHLSIGYEQVIGHRMSLALKAGYIGLWENGRYDDTFNSTGGFLSAGMKFMLPTSSRRPMNGRGPHALSGWYLRPELVFTAWTRKSYSYYYDPYWNPGQVTTTYDYTSAALILTIGRQVMLGERFVFDIYSGYGYGAQWRDGKAAAGGNNAPGRQEYSFSHAFFGNTSPLVVNGGLRFGYVF